MVNFRGTQGKTVEPLLGLICWYRSSRNVGSRLRTARSVSVAAAVSVGRTGLFMLMFDHTFFSRDDWRPCARKLYTHGNGAGLHANVCK